jgi:hypothetical protein
MIALKEPHPVKRPPRNVPAYLVYEIMDGKPIYYKGYRNVINGTKTFEEIMGASSLQGLIVFYLCNVVGKFINEEIYTVLTSESGLHINHRNNLANDIAIFDANLKISKKYADVPPKIAFEIDIDAEVEDMSELGYIYKKTKKLLDFGTEKIFWILTSAQVVMVATQDHIETFNWNRNIEIMDGQVFNIGAYLEKKGVILE